MIKELLAYISHRLDEEIKLEEMSRLTGYSPFHLHRVIKQELGMTIGAFIKQQRIETAAQLLVLTDTPIAEIKYLVGYTNDSSFSKAFSSIMNVSPRNFRANNILKKEANGLSVNYLSLSYDIQQLLKQEAIIFPCIGDYFDKSIYKVWKDVEDYLDHEQLNKKDFDYYGILHNCQNVTPGPSRYDAAIVPKNKKALQGKKYFRSTIPGGKFARYKFCCPVDKYKEYTLLVNKHMNEEACLKHGTGISYFRFSSLPNHEDPDNLLIEWFLPVKQY
ncbi:MAG: AraC family transcriptional regulator [Chitinophagaceae bacterium]|nr:AraC family transcriptional regulator [Chitinophagaceae bacterium]MCB9044533.1 AraC family transcriptional regulator [Chitinophagales bacterium]